MSYFDICAKLGKSVLYEFASVAPEASVVDPSLADIPSPPAYMVMGGVHQRCVAQLILKLTLLVSVTALLAVQVTRIREVLERGVVTVQL